MPSSNPLWFGYYPGDRPMNKRPDKMLPPEPIQMTDMGMNAAIDEAIKAVDAPAELPNQLWEWIVGDWKQKFAVTGVAYKQTGGDILAYDPQEGADVKGVNPTVNLHSLVVDPKKELGKLWGTMINPLNPFAGFGDLKGEFWTDLDTSVERDMWRRLVKGPGGTPGPQPFLFDLAEKAFSSSSGNPINLTGQNVFKETMMWTTGLSGPDLKSAEKPVTGKTDVYNELAENILSFVAGKKNVLQRNPRFTSMQNSLIQAAATELGEKRTDIKADITASAGATLAAATDIKINDFLLEANVVDSIKEFGSGMGNFGKIISKAGITGPAVAAISGGIGDLDKSVTDLRASINTARTNIADVAKRTAFDRDIKRVEGILSRVENFSTNLRGKGASWNPSELEKQALLSDINLINGSLNNFRYGAGAQGGYLMSVTRRHLRGPSSLLKEQFATLPRMSQGYKSLDALCPYLERIYMYEDGRDLIKNVMKGDFPKIYMWWGQMSPRITHFTPAYWTGKVFESTHKFGLDYDDDWAGKEIHKFFKAGNNPLIRENKFKIGFTTRVGTVSGLHVVGGEYLKSATTAWDSYKEGKLVGSLAGATVYASAAKQKEALFAFLNGKEKDFLLANPGMSYIGVFGKSPDKVQKQARELKAYLTKPENLTRLGLTMSGPTDIALNADNEAILAGFFEALSKRKHDAGTIDIFAQYFGGLQWASAKLTGVQQQIFLRFGKVLSPILVAKNAAIKAMSEFSGKIVSSIMLKTGLATALGAATGGIGAFLVPLLERAIQALLSKIADQGKELFRAIMKGDFSRAFDKMMDDALNATQKVLACGCIFPILSVVVIFMLMGTVITAISPTNRASAPSNTGSSTGTDIPVPPPAPISPDAAPTCVFLGWKRTAEAYAGAEAVTEVVGHGSNAYYAPKDTADGNDDNDGIDDCSLLIPYFAGTDPPARGPINDDASWCNNRDPAQTYFGYALDVIPLSSLDTTWTIAPRLGGVSSWSVSRSNVDPGYGCAVTLNGSDGSNTYSLHILHLKCGLVSGEVGAVPSSVAPGQAIALLYNYDGGKHAHLELQVNGDYKKPQDYMCP